MKPEEWQQGMEHEAASVEDAAWVRSTRWAAWRRRRRGELRRVLTWRPLSRLLLIPLIPALLIGALSLGSWPPFLADTLSAFLGAVLSGSGRLLLLVVWTVRYVHLGYIPWALALAGAGTEQLLTGLLILKALASGGDESDAFLRLTAVLMGRALFTFALLWGLGWAITRLSPVSKEDSA